MQKWFCFIFSMPTKTFPAWMYVYSDNIVLRKLEAVGSAGTKVAGC